MIWKQTKKYIRSLILKREKDLHGFDFTVTKTLDCRQGIDLLSDWKGKPLSDDLLQYKTSDTLFILGSGPSVRHVSDSQWSYIKKNDSIGFNFWPVHDFIPSLYLFQIVGQKYKNTIKDAISSKYNNVPIIFRTNRVKSIGKPYLSELEDIFATHSIYFINEVPIHSKCAIDPSLMIQFMLTLNLMNYGKVRLNVPKFRSTIGLLLPLAYQMGYANIILVGIDFKGNDHFWDYPKYKNIKSKYNVPEPEVSNIKLFTDRDYNPVTMSDYVIEMAKWMKTQNDVSVSLINNDSALYPDLPVYGH